MNPHRKAVLAAIFGTLGLVGFFAAFVLSETFTKIILAVMLIAAILTLFGILGIGIYVFTKERFERRERTWIPGTGSGGPGGSGGKRAR